MTLQKTSATRLVKIAAPLSSSAAFQVPQPDPQSARTCLKLLSFPSRDARTSLNQSSERPMMINPTSLSASLTQSRHLSLCPDSNLSANEKCNVLLVEPAMILLSDRERLLQAAGYCVTAVLGLREVLLLRPEGPLTFAILNDLLGTSGLRAAAITVRRQWPLAKFW